MEGKSILIEIDAHSKLGPERIPNVKHETSRNGKLLAAIIDRHALIVINSLQGTITRKRITTEGIKESTIDLVIVSSDLEHNVEKLVVDEERKHALTKLTKK